LAEVESDQTVKGLLKSRESEYIYFVGSRVSSKDEKKVLHDRGYEAGKVAVSLLASDETGNTLRTPDQRVFLPCNTIRQSYLSTFQFFYSIPLFYYKLRRRKITCLTQARRRREWLGVPPSLKLRRPRQQEQQLPAPPLGPHPPFS